MIDLILSPYIDRLRLQKPAGGYFRTDKLG